MVRLIAARWRGRNLESWNTFASFSSATFDQEKSTEESADTVRHSDQFDCQFNFSYFFHLSPHSAAGLFCWRQFWVALQTLRPERSHTSRREPSGVCFSWRSARPASPGAQRSAAPAAPARLRPSPTRPELPLKRSSKLKSQYVRNLDVDLEPTDEKKIRWLM